MNFRGYVAVPLENYCNRYLNGKFNADDIECGQFYEAMINIIDCLGLNENEDIEDFKSKYKSMCEKSYNQLRKENYDCVEVFDEFKNLTGVKL